MNRTEAYIFCYTWLVVASYQYANDSWFAPYGFALSFIMLLIASFLKEPDKEDK
jgi:hypothetical protein